MLHISHVIGTMPAFIPAVNSEAMVGYMVDARLFGTKLDFKATKGNTADVWKRTGMTT